MPMPDLFRIITDYCGAIYQHFTQPDPFQQRKQTKGVLDYSRSSELKPDPTHKAINDLLNYK
tara:strand:- start:289 stop:474 length:186 start_codon:yes stop_codon:yes gene_type:complete